MGYFSNGCEGDAYEAKYCHRCTHYNEGMCPILLLHLEHNYTECNKPNSFLHVLIPRADNGLSNKQCTMFLEATNGNA